MSAPAPTGRSGPRFGRARAGLNKIFAYSISMVLLAIASLVAIPAMVTASGAASWGAHRRRSVDRRGRGRDHCLWLGPFRSGRDRQVGQDRPTQGVPGIGGLQADLVPAHRGRRLCHAWTVGRDYASFAGMGALSMASVGLTANWYFVGRSQPYLLLLMETVPG